MPIKIDWKIVTGALWTVALFFIGAWVNRRYERRAKLISYFGHVSTFRTTLSDGKALTIYAHSVILQNAGRAAATNVRLQHANLPDFVISPEVPYTIESLPSGASQIVIPRLIPKEQITISYLYFPPLKYDQVNAGIRFDEGFAAQIPVLLQRQYPKWYISLLMSLTLIGAISIIYACVYLIATLVHR